MFGEGFVLNFLLRYFGITFIESNFINVGHTHIQPSSTHGQIY